MIPAMYYVWRSDAALSDRYLYASRVPDGLTHQDWITGKPLPKRPPAITLVGDGDSPITLSDMILTQFELPILSPKAMAALESVGVDNIEYFPITIKSRKTG